MKRTALAEQLQYWCPGISNNITSKIFIPRLSMQKQGFRAFETILAYEIYRTAQAAHLFAWIDA